MAVFVSAVSVPGGITTVSPSSATEAVFGSTVDGLIVSVNIDGTVQVQSSGILILTTPEWDAVTGLSGGLVISRTYLLRVLPAAGLLIDSTTLIPEEEFNLPAIQVTRVGVALSATAMLVDPAPPVQHLGTVTRIVSTTSIGQVPLGSLSPPHTIDSNSALLASNEFPGLLAGLNQVCGLLVAYVVNGDQFAVVQFGGVVFLDTGRWSIITGTFGGLTAGTPYYLDTGVAPGSPGHLTSVKPTTAPHTIVQVGVGISTLEMLLSTPCVPLIIP
jgi:hypothetical protein